MTYVIKKETRSLILGIIHLVMDNKNIELSSEVSSIAFDSLRFIKLVVEIEKKFNIEFEDDYLLLHKYKTIEDICEYVESKIG
jgi:acyl carrier protein